MDEEPAGEKIKTKDVTLFPGVDARGGLLFLTFSWAKVPWFSRPINRRKLKSSLDYRNELEFKCNTTFTTNLISNWQSIALVRPPVLEIQAQNLLEHFSCDLADGTLIDTRTSRAE